MKLKTKNKIKENITGYLLILPLLISLIFFTLYPLLLALFQSFFKDLELLRYPNYDWSNFGIDNYIHAFKDPDFWKSLRLTLVYAIISVPLSMTLSFIVSYFLSKDFKGARVYRVLYYLPCLIPGIAGAIIYRYIYSGDPQGFLNSLFEHSFLGKLFPNFPYQYFDNNLEAVSMISFISMSLVSVGASSPFWIAGFKSIPKSYYEAASLDGIGRTRTFFKVTIPMMSKYIFYQAVVGFIGAFQIGQGVLQFSQTAGNGNLHFLGLLIYNVSQHENNFGYASALSYILFILIAGFSVLLFKSNRFVYYEGDN